MLSEEKEAATLVQIPPGGEVVSPRQRGSAQRLLPAQAHHEHQQDQDVATCLPRVTEERTGPPLGPPVLTGGKEGQPCPAPQLHIQLSPDTDALDTKTLGLGFMLYEQRQTCADFRSNASIGLRV